MLLTFRCDRMLRKKLQGGKISFGSQLQRIHSTTTWFHELLQSAMGKGVFRGNVYLLADRGKVCERKGPGQYSSPGCSPSGPLPLHRHHLHKFLEPPKVRPLAESQTQNEWTSRGTFHIQTVTFPSQIFMAIVRCKN